MNPEIRKQLRNEWTRKRTKSAIWVQQQEAELDRMRKKNVSPEFIKAKSDQIDTIIDVINTADDLITLYRNELIAARMENKLLLLEINSDHAANLLTQPTTALLNKLNEAFQKSGPSR